MGNADSASAVFGLLLGLAVQHGPVVAAANAASSGPVAAIEQARSVAASESQRARASDAEAARVLAPNDAAASAANAVPEAATAAVAAPAGVATDPAAPATFDPAKHRDPFRPPNLTPAVAEKSGPRTPLEGYEIGQLRLVGIVKEASNVRAMVEDSAGLGYIVTPGTPIGTSGGVVRAIEQRRMLIQETTTNFYGEKQAKEVVMELPQEDRSP